LLRCFVADANISDELFVRRALELAREGIGLTSPNPCVGAVIVDGNGKIVGTGVHKYETVKHAEVLALERAGQKARGATLYINLAEIRNRMRYENEQGRPCNSYSASGERLKTLA